MTICVITYLILYIVCVSVSQRSLGTESGAKIRSLDKTMQVIDKSHDSLYDTLYDRTFQHGQYRQKMDNSQYFL